MEEKNLNKLILGFSLVVSACSPAMLQQTQSSCVIPEDSVFFDGYVECVDLILPSSSLGDAQQACSEWSGRFITAELCPAATKQMACDFTYSSPGISIGAIAWYRENISTEKSLILDDVCVENMGKLIEHNVSEEGNKEAS